MLKVSKQEKFELIALIDDYVFGFALREAQELDEHERGLERLLDGVEIAMRRR